jgi:type IV pilus assembly protein PilP
MSCKSLMLFVSWAIIPLLFFGCGDKTPKNKEKTAPERQKITAPSSPKKGKKAVELSVKNQDKKEFSYGSSGKRDPFQALTSVKKPIVSGLAVTTPLQKFALNQLRVIGVIWGKGEPTAMVNAPDGKSYVLKKGIKAGKNNGTVVDINKESIVVEEKFYDFSGEVRVSTQNIPLPKKEGVK